MAEQFQKWVCHMQGRCASEIYGGVDGGTEGREACRWGEGVWGGTP